MTQRVSLLATTVWVQTPLALLALLALSACADPIIGARCAPGFEERAGRCDAVDGLRDGEVADGESPLDGGMMDGAPSDGAPSDGAKPDGSLLDGGGGSDGGVLTCDLGELECGDMCVDPETDPDNCGECGMACAAGELCAGGVCSTMCDAPLVMCGGLCVDVMTDPNNCGRCGNRCASNICVDGACADPTAGHVVLVGHDYTTGRTGMNRLAGNALFLASGAPVRTLVYEGRSTVASIRGVDRAIDQVARERGRSWLRSATTADKITFELADADALLVYPQQGESDIALADLGLRFRAALARFLTRGGVVVVFEGSGGNAGTYQLLEAAGLFTAASRTAIPSGMVDVVAPGDAVSIAVPLSYRVEDATFWFDTTDLIAVARHADGPVVIHRVFVP